VGVQQVWWVYSRFGGCTAGLVGVQQVWWVYSRSGGCTAGLVGVQQVWWENERTVKAGDWAIPFSMAKEMKIINKLFTYWSL
jgi:hypothetical protein